MPGRARTRTVAISSLEQANGSGLGSQASCEAEPKKAKLNYFATHPALGEKHWLAGHAQTEIS
jgi:hypothetical protein